MTLGQMVEATLKMFPETRNDDRKLAIAIWSRWYDNLIERGLADMIELDAIFSLPNIESIGRWRRKFQEQGLYPAKKEVSEKRKKHSKRWKKELGYKQPEHVIFEKRADEALKKIYQDRLF